MRTFVNEAIYHEHGFRSRNEYLVHLSYHYDVPLPLILTLSDGLGAAEDFSLLVERLEQYHDDMFKFA